MTFANALPTPTRSRTDLRTRYQQARSQYEADPANPQAIRSLGWVYAHMLKEASGSTDLTRMLRGLGLITAFPMVDDARWRESVGWSICRFLLRHKPETLPLGPLAEVVTRSVDFVPAEPSLLRSVWWKAVLRHAATGIDWLGLVAQHGWEGGFRPEDEEPQRYVDDKAAEPRFARPLVEGLILAVAKQLLQTVVLPDEVTAPWLGRLADLTTRHADWDFLPYYHARLLLRLDRVADAMQVFLPFARSRKKDFWVWGMLAELVAPEHIPACYARALTLRTPEEFLVKLRQRVAAWLISENRWADARAEIDQLVKARRDKQWPLPAEVQQWMNADLYTRSAPAEAHLWYDALLPEAEALLWTDFPETVVLVTSLDASGTYVNVAIDEQTTGSFPVGNRIQKPVVGDRLAIRYTMREKNGGRQLRVQTVRATDLPLSTLTIRTQIGVLRQAVGKAIGFVGDVYVPADLLNGSTGLADGLIKVDAFASWDPVKQKSGWRAFRIQKESVNLPS